MAKQQFFICFVAVNFLSLRRTIVRRNDRKFTRLAYEVFFVAILDWIYFDTIINRYQNGCSSFLQHMKEKDRELLLLLWVV